MPYELQALPEEIKENKRRCWCTGCKKTAWFKDWKGYNWCWRHILRDLRWSEHRWFDIKSIELRWPF